MDQIETGTFQRAADRSQRDRLQVVSWNINRGLQLPGIIDFLSNASADLVLLQEVDVNARRTEHRNVAHEIARALEMNYVFGREFQELGQGSASSPAYHGQATLSRFPIESSRILRFSRQSGFWRPRWFIPKIQKLQRRMGARMALVSQIAWSEQPLTVYNLHLESRGKDDLRSNQLAEVLDDSERYGAGMPVVIAGDFNFDLSCEPAMLMMNRVAVQNPSNNGNRGPTVVRAGRGRGRSIDWILLRGSLNYGNPQLHRHVFASDHHPISLTLHAT